MIYTSKEEFRRSRNRQEQTASTIREPMTRRMLLFYAVECGAKYQYMERNKFRMYSEVPETFTKNKHDVRMLLKELGVESKCSFPVVKSVHNQDIGPGQYQEMWRYGVNCKDADEKGKQIEENLRKALELLHDMESRR